jgi:hypothetical protein
VGEQVEGLEDHADVRPHPGQGATLEGQRLVVDLDRPAVDALQAVDGAAQRALARARGTDHDDDLAGRDVQVDGAQRLEVAERLGHLSQAHDRVTHGSFPSSRPWCRRT